PAWPAWQQRRPRRRLLLGGAAEGPSPFHPCSSSRVKAQNPAWIGRRRRAVRRVFLGGAAWGGLRSGEGFKGRSLGGLGGPVTAVSRVSAWL
uniref:Uncharacterized protein n=1 Tax=Aegilops tauschii subsp. strangulata TaxID=200361 RepID=A0A453CB96_AEGTS